MPRAREYNKKISIYSSGSVPNEFAGNSIVNFKLLDTFAKLETLDKFKYRNIDFGDIDMANSLVVTIRKRSDFQLDYKNMFVIYRNQRYTISDRGFNNDFQDNYIQFLALNENRVNSNAGLFTIYQNFVQSVLAENGTLQKESCTLAQIKALL